MFKAIKRMIQKKVVKDLLSKYEKLSVKSLIANKPNEVININHNRCDLIVDALKDVLLDFELDKYDSHQR